MPHLMWIAARRWVWMVLSRTGKLSRHQLRMSSISAARSLSRTQRVVGALQYAHRHVRLPPQAPSIAAEIFGEFLCSRIVAAE